MEAGPSNAQPSNIWRFVNPILGDSEFQDVSEETEENVYEELLKHASSAYEDRISAYEQRTVSDRVPLVLGNTAKESSLEVGTRNFLPQRVSRLTEVIDEGNFVANLEILSTLEVSRYDLVTYFPGLRHCSIEQMDNLLGRIHSALRPGGVFLLQEYDVTASNRHIVQQIETLFDAAKGTPTETARQKNPHYMSVSDWTNTLANKGFKCVAAVPISEKDPRKSTLLKFVKCTDRPQPSERMSIIREKLTGNIQLKKYHRTSEVIPMAAIYRQMVKGYGEHTYFWDCPYFQTALELISTFFQAYQKAKITPRLSEQLTTQNTIKNTAITLLATIEQVALGVLSLPFWLVAFASRIFLPRQDSDWEEPAKQYQEWHKKHYNHLEARPFHSQRYLPEISRYWNFFGKTRVAIQQIRGPIDLIIDRQTYLNVAVGVAMSVHMLALAMTATLASFVRSAETADDHIASIWSRLPWGVPDSVHVEADQDSPYSGLIIPTVSEEGIYTLPAAFQSVLRNGGQLEEFAGMEELQFEYRPAKYRFTESDYKLYERADPSNEYYKFVGMRVPLRELDRVRESFRSLSCVFTS